MTREEVNWRNELWWQFVDTVLKRRPEPGDFPAIHERFADHCAKFTFPSTKENTAGNTRKENNVAGFYVELV